MRWRVVGVAIGAVVLGFAVYSITRKPPPVEPPSVPGGDNQLEIRSVEYKGGGKTKPTSFGFSLPAGAVTDVVTIRGHNGTSSPLKVMLLEFDVFKETESPVAELSATSTGTSFSTQIQPNTLKRAYVYRIHLNVDATGQKAVYQFNVANS